MPANNPKIVPGKLCQFKPIPAKIYPPDGGGKIIPIVTPTITATTNQTSKNLIAPIMYRTNNI
jgi:hypothetical protein